MKSKNTNVALTTLAVFGLVYIVTDFVRTKYDRIYRIAAGESFYEKTHTHTHTKKHK